MLAEGVEHPDLRGMGTTLTLAYNLKDVLFVAHVGGHSFGSAARHLQARNEHLLERLHPGYAGLIEAFGQADPLAPARRRLDLVRWRAAKKRGSRAVIIITHNAGGGVDYIVAETHAGL